MVSHSSIPLERVSTDLRTEKFLEDDYDLSRCSFKLACSPVFNQHSDYVRRQFVYSLLQVRSPIPNSTSGKTLMR
jgi:hypothetical protein